MGEMTFTKHSRVKYPRCGIILERHNPGAYDVRQEAIGCLQNAPHGRALVRMQPDGGAGAGEHEMVTVEGAQPDIVELIVIDAHQARAAGIVLPDPLLEALMDLLLLIPGGFGGRGIDDVAVSVRVMVIDRGFPGFELADGTVEGALKAGIGSL